MDADPPIQFRLASPAPGDDRVDNIVSADVPPRLPRRSARFARDLRYRRRRQAAACPRGPLEAVELAQVMGEDRFEIVDRRLRDPEVAVEAPWPQQRWVDQIRVIGRADHNHSGSRLCPVELGQEGIDDDVEPAVIVLTLAARADRIELIDENDARRLFARFGKGFLDRIGDQIAGARSGFPIGVGRTQKWNLALGGEGDGEKRLAATGRPR